MQRKNSGLGERLDADIVVPRTATIVIEEIVWGGVKVYRIPEDEEQHSLWEKAVRKGRAQSKNSKEPWKAGKYNVIYSEHFMTGNKSDDLSHPGFIPIIHLLHSLAHIDVGRLRGHQHLNKVRERAEGVSQDAARRLLEAQEEERVATSALQEDEDHDLLSMCDKTRNWQQSNR